MRRYEFLLLWAAVALLLAFRDPDVWFHPHFYAEDGAVFYQDQMILGNRALLLPYNGYWHLAPRLGAALTAVLPVAWAASMFAVLGTAIGSFAICYFYLPGNRFIVHSDALRATACLVIACNFDMHVMTANLLNLQWLLLPVAMLILARCYFDAAKMTRGQTALFSVGMFLIGMTTPILLVILPVVAWIAFRRDMAVRVIMAAFTVALLAQAAAFTLTHGSGSPVPPYLPFRAAVIQCLGAACTSWFYRVLVASLAGTRTALSTSVHRELALPVAGTLLTIAAICLLRKYLDSTRYKLVCWGFGLSLLLMIAPLTIRNTLAWYGHYGQLQGFAENPRYFLLPCWTFVFIVAICLDRLTAKRNEGVACCALAAILSVGIAVNYWKPDGWKQDWRDSAAQVAQWKREQMKRQPRPALAIPIQPAPWAVHLPASSGEN